MLGFQAADEPGLGVPYLAGRLLADGHQRLYRFGALAHLLGRELDGSLDVVALDGLLDELRVDAGVHGAATASRATDAKEVRVALAALASAQAVDKPVAAVAAEDAATEVVVARLRPLASHALFIEPGLYPRERLRVDQAGMAALVDLLVGCAALVNELAGVVGVTQQTLQGGGADLAFGIAARGVAAQAQAVQLVDEPRNGVFAAGVQLESQRHEMMAVGIKRGCADLPAIG
ncbi:MAG TPA: hypothetical protein VK790_01300 [Solirubrobacteraceae bacterium]|nr:hypothetical protein [Solirubrobacteraceae bacterium]